MLASAYFPSIEVIVPFVEPILRIDTPGKGFPSLSTTCPLLLLTEQNSVETLLKVQIVK